MKRKVGVLGGSFDPIHFGHLNLAIRLMEACSLDKVFFVPTALSPLKRASPPHISIAHRLQMVRLAVRPIPSFEVLDWEAENEGPFYTIDTIRRLSQDSSIEMRLLIAEDHLDSFTQWKDYEEVARLAPPLVGSRTLEAPPKSNNDLVLERVKIPLYDVSATEIRSRLSQKKYCGHLLPALVLDYICEHQLYC